MRDAAIQELMRRYPERLVAEIIQAITAINEAIELGVNYEQALDAGVLVMETRALA